MQPLSQDAVRGLMIAAQGLQESLQPPATKSDVLAMIRYIHLMQIDSISVVARSAYFILWSRLSYYNPVWLDELLAEGALFEYWASGTCFMPIEDYPFLLAGTRNWMMKRARDWIAAHPEITASILNHVREHGETRHTDFKRTDGQKTDWLNPKDEQSALQSLIFTGDLMIRRRDNFQRVYDLRERIQPDFASLPDVSPEEGHNRIVLNSIHALGVAKAEWITGYYRMEKSDSTAALKRLEKQGRVMTVAVEGWKSPGYFHPDNLGRVEAAAEGKIPRSKTTLLTPFDPLVLDRARMLDLFNFDYTIEFYFPASKRKYGYFSLPILYKNALIGRLDAKAHRKEGLFEVKSLHFEPGIEVDEPLFAALSQTLHACAMWHETPNIIVREAADPDLADRLSNWREPVKDDE